jgi:glycosyltransferase involved in cell wall biosynthesis
MVSGHACIRVQKMALPLLWKGHDVFLLAKANPWGYEHYSGFMRCEGRNHYIRSIEALSKHVDVFHCHNEPSWFVSAVKEVCDKPVVLDVHDSYLARATDEKVEEHRANGQDVHRIYAEERNNFQLADGLVFCGEVFGNLIKSEFKLSQPNIVLPSYCPEMLYQYQGKPWLGGLVYEGKVSLRSEIDLGGRNFGFDYCIYEDFAQKCKDLNLDFHLYATRKDEPFMKVFGENAFVYQGYPIEELLKRLTSHDWGLVGNMNYTREWEIAYPNKMFEYLAAQVPVVVMNAAASSKFIEENGFGMTVGSIEELCDRWGEHEKFRTNVIKRRKDWAMERHIHKLEGLYRELLG